MTSDFRASVAAWKHCIMCVDISFKTPQEFRLHLRNNHCTKEGGSYVCCYGPNNICGSLPLEGVNNQDYEFHVVKHHVLTFTVEDDTSQEEKFVENVRQKYAHIFSANEANSQPNVVLNQYKWTIFNSAQNLPAVLNDPRRTKREYDLFIKTWGDYFVETEVPPSSYLPEITIKHFETYIKHVKQGFRSNTKKSVKKRFLQKFDSISSPEKLDLISTEIEDIPKIFMNSDFSLENAETFNAIIPWSQLFHQEMTPYVPERRTTVKLLHEKMSHYLDIVEVQIAKQISMRSEAFFHAMTSHDTLMDQLKHVIKSVCCLREKIHVIEDVLVTGPMKIMKLKRRQKNFNDIFKKLKLMSTVHQTQPTIQLLLNTSEFVGALDLIYTTQDVLSLELSGIHSFRHLGSQLAEMEKVIDKMMETDFLRYITADLNRPHTECLLMEEERLVAIVLGMLRQQQFNFIQTFKEECFTTIEATVKQTVIEVVSEADDVDIESKAGNLSEQLRMLSFEKWINLFQLTMDNLLFLVQRIQVLYLVMDDTLSVAAGFFDNVSSNNSHRCHSLYIFEGENEVMISEQIYLQEKSKLKNVLVSVCDHAHDYCAKILNAKLKDGSLDRLILEEFSLIAKYIENFQKKTKAISGKQSTALQLTLQNLANRYVTKFHEDRKFKLNSILETEQWKQAEVPMEFQELVNHIISTGNVTSLRISKSACSQKPEDYLKVESEEFAVTGTALMLLKMALEYCQCAEDLPMVAADLATRLIDLLKAFNSKTCQLILGAGALKLVGLKTITTKHLALTSRCLQLIVNFIPFVKGFFKSKVPEKQQMIEKHFDNVTTMYMEHNREINCKLETIITDMLEAELNQWEVKAPVPSPAFSAISLQLTRVHRLLLGLLPPAQLESVFLRAHVVFKSKLRQHLARLQVACDGGPKHGFVTQDLTFYMENLKKLNVSCTFDVSELWQQQR